MGEEPGEGDEVVDEKLWGEDEERPNDPNAKTEKDAPVKVSSLRHSHEMQLTHGTGQHAAVRTRVRLHVHGQAGLPCVALMPQWWSQVDDKSNLEYQAGQPDDDEGNQQEPDEQEGQDRPKQAPEDKQGAQAAGPEDGADEQGDDEEGGVNEDADDQYEDRQFAQPQVCCCLDALSPACL